MPDGYVPFVLGKQLGALVDEAERRLVQSLLVAIEDPADRLTTLHRMAHRAPAAWKDPERLRLRLSAFRHGLEQRSPADS